MRNFKRIRVRLLLCGAALAATAVGCNLEQGETEQTPEVEELGTAPAVDTPDSSLDSFGATSTARLQATPTQSQPGDPVTNGAIPTPTTFVLTQAPDGPQGAAPAVTVGASTSNLPATPDSNQPGGFRIESNFDTPGTNWISSSDETVARGYENGMYFLSVLSPEGLLWGYTLGPKTGDTPPRDVVIEADVQLSQGGGEISYGFLCRRTEGENYYYFVLDNLEQAQIGRMTANESASLTGPIAVAGVQPPQSTNHLRAGCIGSTLWLEVNGNVVAQVQDSAFSEGDYGLFLMNNRGGVAQANYDNAVIVAR
ncbi:hypothetical protein [Aggregatilinea lenta]|uniref:hypothetical protein n=1 Tax=Aggregatilinea lenta TaxID=913108 RepID=UPI0013C2E31A|nr:hypothetical protein [Aggregatilinea lenta]